jgi:diamine N-acetyltransferase
VSWTLRRASLADVDTLALVGAATFLETFAGILEGPAIVAHCRREHDPDAYRRYLDGGATAWLAEAAEGAAPIGYAMIARPMLPEAIVREGDLELKRIYTLSRFHGGGVGGRLMHEAVAQVRTLGAQRLLLGVYAGNARALAFYAKHGFAQVGRRMFRVGNTDCDDRVLAKPLD